jgi:hypothetical protein
MNPGLLLFARYAYPPNLLGYCGPADNASLGGYLSEQASDDGLLEIARKFEGAYPWLRLIAQANDIPDPFDRAVVEAYWVGGPLLGRVGAGKLFDALRDRFKTRMAGHEFSWLTAGLDDGCVPHHDFHVFEIYRRAGLMRDDRAVVALDRMDKCRISWGRVMMVEREYVVAARMPLVMKEGKLGLGKPVPVRVRAGEQDDYRAGDVVSLHWDWVCDRLDEQHLRSLVDATRRSIRHANQTM